MDDLTVNGEMSCSDDESVSLLRDLYACQIEDAVEELVSTDSQATNIDMESVTEINPLPLVIVTIDLTQEPDEESTQTVTEKSCEVPRELEETSVGIHDSAQGSNRVFASEEAAPKPLKVPTRRQLLRRNSKGETLLHRACKRKCLAEVKMLLEAGISVNMKDYAGWTPLHEAAAVGDYAVMEELLKSGADINSRSSDGSTPLHDAVYAENYQGVKLLLESGSNPLDKTCSGINAVQMADDEGIRKLLLTFTRASAKKKGERDLQRPNPGLTPSAPRCSNATNLEVRDEGEGTTSDLRSLNVVKISSDELSNPVARIAVLEKLRRKQIEISTWLLSNPQTIEKFQAALTQIQLVLKDVLTKQHLGKENLAQKYQRVSDSLRHHVLRTKFISLASCQRSLLEVLQKQVQLEEFCISVKVAFSTPPPRPVSGATTQLHDHMYSRATAKRLCRQESLQSRRPNEAGDGGAASQVRLDGAPVIRPEARAEKSSSVQMAAAAEAASHTKKKNQNESKPNRAEDKDRNLRRLVEEGLVMPGSSVQLLWKEKQYLAHVKADGSLTSKGKLFRTPERWVESVIVNNIPVGAEYALNKVTFKNIPLSQHLLNLETEEDGSDLFPDESNLHSMDVCVQEEPTQGRAVGSLESVLNIKTIHLVMDDEFVPSSIMDYYWDKLLQADFLKCEDWNEDL